MFSCLFAVHFIWENQYITCTCTLSLYGQVVTASENFHQCIQICNWISLFMSSMLVNYRVSLYSLSLLLMKMTLIKLTLLIMINIMIFMVVTIIANTIIIVITNIIILLPPLEISLLHYVCIIDMMTIPHIICGHSVKFLMYVYLCILRTFSRHSRNGRRDLIVNI